MIHTGVSVKDRVASLEKLRQEILGSKPSGRFDAFPDLNCELAPDEKDTAAQAALRFALSRDAKHCTAGPVYIRKLGMSQALRALYDGGLRLAKGGAR